MNKETYILPVYWVNYLEFGYDDNASEEEIKEIKDFLGNELTYLSADVENAYFKHRNDVNNIGGDVCEFTFLTTKQ
jgi:hypothetical protein